ncbi:hypothetical protein M436DRAFT_62605 [Aureobasidium namibiae CBS 147.97]|uniref:Uncharacterized protein n=1 Tax=Aureobasidium namibiae CBS 147.97 TaxID=1043004 RepID=A0A074WRI3_9PEZI
MDNPDIKAYSETQAPCYRFAASGNCSGCENEHHPNVSPALVGMIVPQHYRVSNEVGIACRPCIENMRECDKQSHHPTDERDPCSECRHFGGEKVQCQLSWSMSYNDAVYRQMLVRHGDHEYKLPPFVQARSKGPMPTERVKTDWQGQSAEFLLAKGDFLPTGVRDCPRAFTVPARESSQRIKNKRFLANQSQRLSQSSPLAIHSQPWQGYSQSSFMTPHGPTQPVVWPSQPPPVPPMIWAPHPVLWTPQYAAGHQMPYPHMPYPFQMPASLPRRPHFPSRAPPPPPPSFPVNSNRVTSSLQPPSSSPRRSVAPAHNQQSYRKKLFGYDGIFSTDALQRET